MVHHLFSCRSPRMKKGGGPSGLLFDETDDSLTLTFSEALDEGTTIARADLEADLTFSTDVGTNIPTGDDSNVIAVSGPDLTIIKTGASTSPTTILTLGSSDVVVVDNQDVGDAITILKGSVDGLGVATTGTVAVGFSLPGSGPVARGNPTQPTDARDTSSASGSVSVPPFRDPVARISRLESATEGLTSTVPSSTEEAAPRDWSQPARRTSMLSRYISVLSIPSGLPAERTETSEIIDVLDEQATATAASTEDAASGDSSAPVALEPQMAYPEPVHEAQGKQTTSASAGTTAMRDLLSAHAQIVVPPYQRTPAWLALAYLGVQPPAPAPEAALFGMSKTRFTIVLLTMLMLSVGVSTGAFLGRKKRF
jgi:hypothetical protein